ncbi:MAG: MBL fold metallo-hydrolase [Thiotrichaceae bacterium]|nr:MBL fold metallo-hydrolase [Thiotrichaceae bacterium]
MYKGPISDNYDGTRFFHNERDYTFTEMLKWMWTMNPPKWPEWIEDPAYTPPPKQVGENKFRITHINQATILIQTAEVNILTDPIWSERSSPVSWIGPKRVRAPGVKMNDLPTINVVLISHDHYDHLDIPTLKTIAARDNPKIIAGLGVGALLRSKGLNNVVELDWWQDHSVRSNSIKITFVPARHNSGRGLFDKNKTLWGGFVVESPAGRLYFSGDTAYGEFLSSIKNKFGDFKVALLSIGHYEPRWIMETHHMNPDDAVKLHKYMNIEQSIGMHFGTFGGHNDEKVNDHEKDLKDALQKYGVQTSEFWLLGFGEGRDISI